MPNSLNFSRSRKLRKMYPSSNSRSEPIFQSTNSTFQISNLGVLEAQSAFAMKVRTGQITPAKAIALQARVLSDVADRTVYVITLEPAHFTSAGLLVAKYGFGRRMRTLDAIQLAVALDLHSQGLLDVFVVADKILAEVAILEGLSIENPEDTP